MEMTEKMVNVRRATRLLAGYYRRVIDIVSLVDNTMESQARFRAKFLRWDSTHHRHIGQQTTAVVGRWGWDFLPIQDATFQWTTDGKKSPVGPGSVTVSLWHRTDEGYQERDDETEPVPHDFLPATETATNLYVYVHGVVQGGTRDRWWSIESVADDAISEDVMWDGQLHDVPVDALDEADPGTQIRYTGWRVPMHLLEAEDDVDAKILVPLKDVLDRIVVADPT